MSSSVQEDKHRQIIFSLKHRNLDRNVQSVPTNAAN